MLKQFWNKFVMIKRKIREVWSDFSILFVILSGPGAFFNLILSIASMVWVRVRTGGGGQGVLRMECHVMIALLS